jgi:hypothetical protein
MQEKIKTIFLAGMIALLDGFMKFKSVAESHISIVEGLNNSGIFVVSSFPLFPLESTFPGNRASQREIT